MTAAEAISRLQHILINNTQLAEADREAICMAIDAVNKRIPIKPVSQMKFGKYGTIIGLCPICCGGNNSEYPYCGGCGQMLDWGDTE